VGDRLFWRRERPLRLHSPSPAEGRAGARRATPDSNHSRRRVPLRRLGRYTLVRPGLELAIPRLLGCQILTHKSGKHQNAGLPHPYLKKPSCSSKLFFWYGHAQPIKTTQECRGVRKTGRPPTKRLRECDPLVATTDPPID